MIALLVLLPMYLSTAVLSISGNSSSSMSRSRSRADGVVDVKVFHFIIPHWGESTRDLNRATGCRT